MAKVNTYMNVADVRLANVGGRTLKMPECFYALVTGKTLSYPVRSAIHFVLEMSEKFLTSSAVLPELLMFGEGGGISCIVLCITAALCPVA